MRVGQSAALTEGEVYEARSGPGNRSHQGSRKRVKERALGGRYEEVARWQLIAGVALTGVGLVGAAAADRGQQDETTRDSDGAVVEGGEIGASSIRIGDCLVDVPDDEFNSVTAVPCDHPHDDEVYYSFQLPEGDGSWPGQEHVGTESDDGCFNVFATIIGEDYVESPFYYDSLTPTEQGWTASDNREVLCLVNNGDGTQKVGSAIASGR